MTKIIDFYFDLISPLSYLAHVKLPALANRYDRKIIYHPIDIPSAKIAAGNYGPSNREVKPKIKVMLADLQRWAKRYEAPFAFPKNLDCELWNRVAVYAEENGKAREFVRGAYHAIWGEGGDPTDLERLRAVADEAGLDGEIALAWAQSPEGSARFKRSCVDAHSRGIFGAPIMVADEEFFWGNDRLDFLEEYLASVQ